MENENVVDVSAFYEFPSTIEETINEPDGKPFTEEEIKEIKDVFENGTDENLFPSELVIGLDTGIPGGDISPISEEEKIDLIAKLEQLREELEETEDHLFEEKLEAETVAMNTYIDGMFHMSEIQDLLQANSTNIFSNEVLEKMDKLLFKIRSLIAKERNKFNKTLVKQNLPKKDREQMLKIFFNQTKPLRDDITKFSQLVLELKRTKKVIKEAAQRKK